MKIKAFYICKALLITYAWDEASYSTIITECGVKLVFYVNLTPLIPEIADEHFSRFLDFPLSFQKFDIIMK